ncbi:craniofacial development protein 2-like [Palaemon carinicauda]|uniref:craniofacial development protein 2-like n=1 Tax=Palaemon carinicauda TaxID=392227 RepID=UPI0035B5F470
MTLFTFALGDFNDKLCRNKRGESAVHKFGVSTRNDREDMFVAFSERNSLKIIKILSYQRKELRKWTWRSPNGETKTEIDFILSEKVNFRYKSGKQVKINHHVMVRSKICLDLGKESEN